MESSKLNSRLGIVRDLPAEGEAPRPRPGKLGALTKLPLVTALVLATGILAWNLSFYQDYYLDQAAAAVRQELEEKSTDAPGDEVVLRNPVEVTDPVAAEAAESSEGGLLQVQRTSDTLSAPGSEGESAASAAVASGAPPEDEKIYYLDGHLRSEGLRKDGRRQGEWSEYYPTGQLLSRGSFVDDLREGPWTYWYENGGRKHEGDYRTGRRTGGWESWHENGTPLQAGSYADGDREGEWRQWYTNGQVMEAGTFQRGVRVGHWEFYTFDGREDGRTGFYENGRRTR